MSRDWHWIGPLSFVGCLCRWMGLGHAVRRLGSGVRAGEVIEFLTLCKYQRIATNMLNNARSNRMFGFGGGEGMVSENACWVRSWVLVRIELRLR
jgi:hypothetical protein